MAVCGIILGIGQENICRIQWDDCPRHKIPNKFPRFLHILSFFLSPNLNVGLVLVVVLCIGNASAVSTGVGSGAGAITKIDCSAYDSQSSGYVSVYNDEVGTNTYANDLAYFKQAYCGTSTNVQTPQCYIISRSGVAKSKVVVADCAQGMTAKIYFVQSGGEMINGTLTSLPSTYDTYVSFVAACDQCTGSTTGSWTTTGAPTGYQMQTTTTKSSSFCNICETTSSSKFRCASGYYGPTNQQSPTGCTACTTTAGYSATSTPGSNTNPSNCSYKCTSGYYGTATGPKTGCSKCVSNATCAGGNNSTFVCNDGYFASKTGTYVGCFACPQNATCTTDNYTCNLGYYPSAAPGTNYIYSCTACPGEYFHVNVTGGVVNSSVYAGNTYGPRATAVSYDITDCYIPANHYYGYKDDSGSFFWSENCHYSN